MYLRFLRLRKVRRRHNYVVLTYGYEAVGHPPMVAKSKRSEQHPTLAPLRRAVFVVVMYAYRGSCPVAVLNIGDLENTRRSISRSTCTVRSIDSCTLYVRAYTRT